MIFSDALLVICPYTCLWTTVFNGWIDQLRRFSPLLILQIYIVSMVEGSVFYCFNWSACVLRISRAVLLKHSKSSTCRGNDFNGIYGVNIFKQNFIFIFPFRVCGFSQCSDCPNHSTRRFKAGTRSLFTTFFSLFRSFSCHFDAFKTAETKNFTNSPLQKNIFFFILD